MLDISAKQQTTENTSQTTISTTVLSCNCRKYCPAVNSTKLDVSYRRLFSYMLMCEVIYWGDAIWVAVELYFLGQNVRQDKRVNNLNLVASTFRHFETVEKSLAEKVSSGLQKILDHEWSSFSSEPRAAREKVKLCKLIIFSLLNIGFRACFSLLPRPSPTRVLDVLCLTRKIRDCSQSKKIYQESWLFHPLHLLHFACGKTSFFPSSFRVFVWHFPNYSWIISVYLGQGMHILNFLSHVNSITVF